MSTIEDIGKARAREELPGNVPEGEMPEIGKNALAWVLPTGKNARKSGIYADFWHREKGPGIRPDRVNCPGKDS